MQLSTATAGTFTGDISFPTNVNGKNPFNFRITGTVSPAPHIVVDGPGQVIADGDTTPSPSDGTDFGSAVQDRRGPDADLHGAQHGDGRADSGHAKPARRLYLTEPLSATIAAGGSDSFTVQVGTGTIGTFTGEISFATNDASANPFNFAVTATVSVSPVAEIVVDGPGAENRRRRHDAQHQRRNRLRFGAARAGRR